MCGTFFMCLLGTLCYNVIALYNVATEQVAAHPYQSACRMKSKEVLFGLFYCGVVLANPNRHGGVPCSCCNADGGANLALGLTGTYHFVHTVLLPCCRL